MPDQYEKNQSESDYHETFESSRPWFRYLIWILIIGVIAIGAFLTYRYFFAQEEVSFFSQEPSSKPSPIPSSASIPSAEELEARSKFSAFIQLTPADRVKVFLYAPDETTESRVVDVPTCIFPEAGKGYTIYKGNYQLILDTSTWISDIAGQNPLPAEDLLLIAGHMEFLKGSFQDAMYVEANADGLKNKVILYEPEGCSNYLVSIYGYDSEEENLVQYQFKHLEGSVMQKLLTGSGGVHRTTAGNFVVTLHDVSTNKWADHVWKFNKAAKLFEEIRAETFEGK